MERLKPLLRIAGYGAWFSFAFTVFLWLTFPWNKVADKITVDAADSGVAFTVDKLRPAIVGARTRGLVVGPLGQGGSPWLQAEKLKAKTSIGGAVGAALAVRTISAEGGASSQRELLHRLMNAIGVIDVVGEMYGADVDISMKDEDKEAMRLALETGRLDLSAYALPSGLLDGAPKGRLQANADVLWHWEDAKKTSGSVDLKFTDLALEGLKVGGFGLPPTTFDRAEAHLKMAKGRAEFRNTAFESDVINLVVEGFINLKPNIMASTLSLRLKFKVREDLEGLLSMAGLKKDSSHRDKDGWFHYQGQGRVTKARFTERRVARSGSRKSKPRKKVTDDDGEDVAPAPRRAARKRKSVSADEDEEEPVSRDPMSEERRQEIEEQRSALRDERLKRREERRRKREELMEKRRERQESGELEDNGRVIRRPSNDEFERSNDVEPEILPEEGEQFEDGEGDQEFDEGEYEE
ncbi:MAG: type II secretion system protein GspN, partial [Deltaproteobacteria bacterium]|nr:type II secretion system protein GspN [Deltaproteobacteria bacterium]